MSLELESPSCKSQSEEEESEPSQPSPEPGLGEEIGKLARLAFPVFIANLGHMLMGVVDIVMVGKLGPTALGAVALGNTYVFSFFVLNLGLLFGLDPLISQAYGGGKSEEVGRFARAGFLLAALLTVPTLLWYGMAGTFLGLLGQPKDVVSGAQSYIWGLMPGVFFSYFYISSRQYIQALERMKPAMYIILAANGVNFLADWILIHGHLGFPALGVQGAGFATSICRVFAALAMVAYMVKSAEVKGYLEVEKGEVFSRSAVERLVKMGAPISLQLGLEVWCFASIALGMGWLGTRELAGHQIALNLASLAFMGPLALSSAAAVRVGHAIGRKSPRGPRRAWLAALVITASLSACFALAFWLVPEWLARIYTSNQQLLALVTSLLGLAAFFQVFDSLQVVGSGILRGAGDTRFPLVFNLVGHWFFSLPLGFFLVFGLGWGPLGFWWGLLIGTAIVAGLMISRVEKKLPSPSRSK